MAGIKYSTGYSLNGGHLTSAPSSSPLPSLPVARVMNGTRARQNPFDGRHHEGGSGGIKTRSEFYDRRDLLSFGAMHKPIYFGIPPGGSAARQIFQVTKSEREIECVDCRVSRPLEQPIASQFKTSSIRSLAVGTSLVKWRRRRSRSLVFFAHHHSQRI